MGDAMTLFMEDDKTTVAVSLLGGAAGTYKDDGTFAIMAGNNTKESCSVSRLVGRRGRGWKKAVLFVFVCASLLAVVAALLTAWAVITTTRRFQQVPTTRTETERRFYCRQIAAGECDYRNWDDSMSYIAEDLASGTLTPDDVINWLSPTCNATCIRTFLK
jgi:hypothetical protein